MNAEDSLEGLMELDWTNLPPRRRAPLTPAGGSQPVGLASVPESPVAAREQEGHARKDDSGSVDPSAGPSALIALAGAGGARSDDEDVCSHVADEGDWTDEEVNSGRIHVRFWTAGGALAGTAVVDPDATVGQLVAKLDKLPDWHARYDHFVVKDVVFKFRAHRVRFTQAAAVQEAVVRDARGDRVLHVQVVSSDV